VNPSRFRPLPAIYRIISLVLAVLGAVVAVAGGIVSKELEDNPELWLYVGITTIAVVSLCLGGIALKHEHDAGELRDANERLGEQVAELKTSLADASAQEKLDAVLQRLEELKPPKPWWRR